MMRSLDEICARLHQKNSQLLQQQQQNTTLIATVNNPQIQLTVDTGNQSTFINDAELSVINYEKLSDCSLADTNNISKVNDAGDDRKKVDIKLNSNNTDSNVNLNGNANQQTNKDDGSNSVIYFKEYDPHKNRFKSAVRYSPIINADILQSPLRLITPIDPINSDNDYDQPIFSSNFGSTSDGYKKSKSRLTPVVNSSKAMKGTTVENIGTNVNLSSSLLMAMSPTYSKSSKK
ncbi:unnamed protein product [Anisakis simplex]|uniref:Serine/threonine-protein kinase DDB_G0282963 n=1 Tax=Anisakis simplex TaxID=6269 RepID=A0A0M3J7K4_ANISI|nr:unnamed protein product [Anisakis simplex]